MIDSDMIDGEGGSFQMTFQELVMKNRSYRRFREDEGISSDILRELVALARITPSPANKQPLKYLLSNTAERNAAVFDTLGWAGYLKDWPGPPEGERPSAYIIVLGDSDIAEDCSVDAGIVMQTMLFGAVEKGLGGCIFGSVKRLQLSSALNISDRYKILYIVALGVPVEKVILEEMGPAGDIRYHRDGTGVHHVPKRPIGDLILD